MPRSNPFVFWSILMLCFYIVVGVLIWSAVT